MCTSDISSHNYGMCCYNYMIFVDEVVKRLAVVSCCKIFTFGGDIKIPHSRMTKACW